MRRSHPSSEPREQGLPLEEVLDGFVRVQPSASLVFGPRPKGPDFTARKRMSKGEFEGTLPGVHRETSPNLRILPYDDIDLSQAVDRDFGHCLEIENTRRNIQ
jgi:hypothetical protein